MGGTKSKPKTFSRPVFENGELPLEVVMGFGIPFTQEAERCAKEDEYHSPTKTRSSKSPNGRRRRRKKTGQMTPESNTSFDSSVTKTAASDNKV
ncbi:unnamed protein product [Blepharisma stoltei]|uniref:Uncharacterized protein n=1 Tax=Blepharisma stoltei TaxID=1481888 RepID=A0AAU9JEM8_9CILI|nr:unnamed protein product [Blepharisma stoltei]